MWGCLDKYIRVGTWNSQTKFSGSTPASDTNLLLLLFTFFSFSTLGTPKFHQNILASSITFTYI